MDDYVDSPGDSQLFSACNMNRGYRKIDGKETDKANTAFSIQHELNQSIREVFGLKHALPTFQRGTVIILLFVNWQVSIVYLDVLVIFSSTPRQHNTHINLFSVFLEKPVSRWR